VLVAVEDWMLMLALCAAAALVAVGMVRPALLVAVFVLVRPILDYYSGSRLGGLSSANPGGALGLLLLSALAVLLAGARSLFQPRATWPFVALLVVSAAAAANSLLSLGGTIGLQPVSEILRLAVLVAIYLLAANLFRDSKAVRNLFVMVGLSGVIPAAIGIYTWIASTADPGEDGVVRLSGTFSGPLPFSAYLAVCALVLISAPPRTPPGWVRLPALALILTALVGTYSREGWITFLLGAALLLWRRRKARVIALAVAAALVIAIVPTARARFLPGAEPSSTSGGTYSSYNWRIGNWQGLLGKAAERPFFGWGLQTTAYINPRARFGFDRIPGSGFDAHNTAVRAVVEGGVVLLAVYVLLIATIVGRLWHIQRAEWDLRPFARTVYWIWVVLIVIALTSNDPFEQTTTMYALLVLTGSVEGAHARWLGSRPGDAIGEG